MFQAGDCQFFQCEDMMEQMSPIPIVSLASTTVQDVPEVTMVRDRIDMIVDHLKWIEKLVCVHSCCSIYNTNTTTDKVICSGSKLTSVVVSEPLQMTRC
jgi:hypothetical protein